jgi:small subunit ribosomal protein S20
VENLYVAHSISAKKRIRQNAKRRARNRARKLQIKQSVRAFDEAVHGTDPGKASETLKAAIKKLDKIAATGTIHKNTASRRKSQLQKRYNAMVAQGAK